MKYIKKFEIFSKNVVYPFDVKTTYLISYDNKGTAILNIDDVFNYLKFDYIEFIMNEQLEDFFKLEIFDFLKEILIDKRVKFKSEDRIEKNPEITGIVKEIDIFTYQDEFYLKLKVKKEWHLLATETFFKVFNYDAYKKPLHQKAELNKKGEKYNI